MTIRHLQAMFGDPGECLQGGGRVLPVQLDFGQTQRVKRAGRVVRAEAGHGVLERACFILLIAERACGVGQRQQEIQRYFPGTQAPFRTLQDLHGLLGPHLIEQGPHRRFRLLHGCRLRRQGRAGVADDAAAGAGSPWLRHRLSRSQPSQSTRCVRSIA